MSISMIVLKEIEAFSHEKLLRSVQQAAGLAGIHCVHVNTGFDADGNFEYLEGGLSEADAETLQSNFKSGIHTRTCGFSIERPTDISYDSFTWLLNRDNYFGALTLQYLGHDFEFAFRFLAQYFRLQESSRDYLWVDDTDWFYSAGDMIRLSRQPYRPEWSYRRLC